MDDEPVYVYASVDPAPGEDSRQDMVVEVTNEPGDPHVVASWETVEDHSSMLELPPLPTNCSQERPILVRGRSLTSSTELISSDTSSGFNNVSNIIHEKESPKPEIKCTALTEMKVNVVKKVIVLQPGQDPEQATAEAIESITKTLDKEAAERLAQGKTPQKETVIEIMRIRAPEEGYFSHENLKKTQCQSHMVQFTSRSQERNVAASEQVFAPPRSVLPVSTAALDFGTPEERKHHRRKSPHPKRYMYRTPSPPGCKKAASRTGVHNLSSGCYFQPKPKCSAAFDTASSKLLGSRVLSSQQHGASITHTITSLHGLSSGAPARSQARLPAILRNSRPSMDGGVPLTAGLHLLAATATTASSTTSESDSSQELKEQSRLDDSLTNIQWLGAMSGDKLTSNVHRDLRVIATEKQIQKISRECGRKKRPPYSYMHLIQMAICSKPDKKMTLREIYKWIEDTFPFYRHCQNQGWKNSIRHNLSLYDIFVREKPDIPGRTGSSYWTLAPDASSKITRGKHFLPEAALGRPPTPIGHCPSPFPPSDSSMGRESPQFLLSSSTKGRKGPVPLLPKPPPMPAYALIPIQGGVPVVPSQPIMLSSVTMDACGKIVSAVPGSVPAASQHRSQSPAMEHYNIAPTMSTPTRQIHSTSIDPGSGGSYLGKSVLKRLHSPTETTSSGPKRKHVKIAPKVNIYGSQTTHSFQQKCHDQSSTSSHHSSLVLGDSGLGTSMDTTDLQNQLSQMRFDSGGMDVKSDYSLHKADCSNYEESPGDFPPGLDVKVGLPIPTMYRRKSAKHRAGHSALGSHDTPSSSESDPSSSSKKGVLLTLNDSSISDKGLSDILSSIEKSLSSPVRNLLTTPDKPTDKNLLTSTPFKETLGSPSQWMSPIKGLTPISAENATEGVLFTPDKVHRSPGKMMTRSPTAKDKFTKIKNLGLLCLTPLKTPFKTPPKVTRSGNNSEEQSPNDSISAIHNQSFSTLIGDLHFECMIDEGINLDVSNMSFSALQ